MKKVSVVIPIYNAELFLDKCVTSVLEQTYKNIEVILVNDGSKDNSPRICDNYARNDNRVTVIHQENMGLSEARNNGLKIATGYYIMFLDSDDFWIYQDGLEKLLSHPALSNDDFVFLEFNRCRYIPSKNIFFNFPRFPKSLENCSNVDTVVNDLIKMGIFPMSACTKVIKRQFLIDNNIIFIPRLLSEDTPWFTEILLKAKTGIAYYNYYLYGNRAEVLTSLSSTFSEKKVQDILWIVNRVSDEIKKSRKTEKTKEYLLSSLAYKYILLLIQCFSNKKRVNPKYFADIKCAEWILAYDVHPKVKKVNALRKYLGSNFTFWILAQYMKNKDSIKRLLKK